MKTLNTKLVLSALGIALLATPAFAQTPDRQPSQTVYAQAGGQSSVGDPVTGSASNQYERDHGQYPAGSVD